MPWTTACKETDTGATLGNNSVAAAATNRWPRPNAQLLDYFKTAPETEIGLAGRLLPQARMFLQSSRPALLDAPRKRLNLSFILRLSRSLDAQTSWSTRRHHCHTWRQENDLRTRDNAIHVTPRRRAHQNCKEELRGSSYVPEGRGLDPALVLKKTSEYAKNRAWQ